jgi:hypothetical protein
MDRKKKILFVLLGIFAISVIYRVLNPYKQGRVERVGFNQSDVRKPIRGRTPPLESRSEENLLLINLLMDPPKHSGRVYKDLFFNKPAAPKQPPTKSPKPRKYVSKHRTVPPAVDPLAQVRSDLSAFRVFGFYRSGHERSLFLEREKEILVIREGDRIDGKYLVKRIDDHSLVLRAEHIGEDVEIDLSDF